jgi:hypothetical protein
MIREKQDGEDLVFVAVDRTNAQSVIEALRMNGNSGVIRSPYDGGSGNPPGVTVGSAGQLGTAPSASVVGTGVACEVTLNTGSGTSAFTAATPQTAFTLSIPSGVFAITPFCSVEPSNAVAAEIEAGGITAPVQALLFYFDRTASSPTSLVFKAVSNGTPTLTASTAYKLMVWISG